ncbi:helix-turn-helix domain-containing protein (plasmid) [Haloarcula sp. NS06]|uniref:AlbA family DNA-binding domain-containing protein n=1 Tax=Haloarcula sp. NS06 TaxID=3409688 RepID=UPI003DA6E686
MIRSNERIAVTTTVHDEARTIFHLGNIWGEKKDEEFKARIEVGHTDTEMFLLAEAESRKDTLYDGFQTQSDKVINFGTQNTEGFTPIINGISQALSTPSGTRITGVIPDVSGKFEDRFEDEPELDFDLIKHEIDERALHLHPYDDGEFLGHVFVPHRPEMRDGEMSEETQLDELKSLLESVQSSFNSVESDEETAPEGEPAEGGRADISELRTKELAELLERGESEQIEFKETFLYHTYKKEPDKTLKEEVAKEVCSFANTDGGVVIIGVEDEEKEVMGLKRDYDVIKKGKDGFEVQLHTEIASRLGDTADASCVESEFRTRDEQEVCLIWVTAESRTSLFRGG